MKLASILVFLVLLLLPITFQFFYIIYKLAAKGVKGMDELIKPSPKIQRFMTRRKLFYSIISVYGAIFSAALLWMFYETISNVIITNLGISLRALVLILITQIIIWGIYFTFLIKKSTSIFKKYPLPDVDPSNPLFLEWQKSINAELDIESNYKVDHIWHYLARILPISFGLVFFMGLVIWLIATFVH